MTPEPSDPERTELSDMINDVELFQETVGGEEGWDEHFQEYTKYETLQEADRELTDENTDESNMDGDQSAVVPFAEHYFNTGENYLVRYYISNPGEGVFEYETDKRVTDVFCRDNAYSLYGCCVGQSKEEAKTMLEENGWTLWGDQWTAEETDDSDIASAENDSNVGLYFRFDENGVITEIHWRQNEDNGDEW